MHRGLRCERCVLVEPYARSIRSPTPMGVISPSAPRASMRASVVLATGRASSDKRTLLILRLETMERRTPAGTVSPGLISTMSPGTTSRAATCLASIAKNKSGRGWYQTKQVHRFHDDTLEGVDAVVTEAAFPCPQRLMTFSLSLLTAPQSPQHRSLEYAVHHSKVNGSTYEQHTFR